MLRQESNIGGWDDLRAFGTNRVVQLTSLVPILGYFLLFGESFNEFLALNFGGGSVIDSEKPDVSLWRAYWLYFGFCFLGAASLLFSFYCPGEVKVHGADYEFVARESETITISEINVMREHLRRNEWEKRQQAGWPDFDEMRRIHGGPSNQERAEHVDAVNEWLMVRSGVMGLETGPLMVHFFGLLVVTGRRKRWWITRLNRYGLLIVFVPTAWTFGEVSIAATKAFWSVTVQIGQTLARLFA